MKSLPQWVAAVPCDDVEAAEEDSFVDAYGDYEKHTGVMTMLEERLKFPFQAKVMGSVVSAVGMQWPESDEFGLDLMILGQDSQQHRVAARNVEPLEPFPEGIEFLVVYLDWRRRF